MYRFTKFLNTLEHYELVRLKKELEKGTLDVEKEILGQIKEHEKKHSAFCVTCSNTLDRYNANNYTLLFGPEDFMKKASFCGLDCLEYFFIKLKQMKKSAGKSEISGTNSVGEKNTEKIE
ncbi:MAG: hypothetical protein IIC69_02700 [Nanoarchaeota archaeon]|nr:hypothetical protein [Nanoarchaeota archaeon]